MTDPGFGPAQRPQRTALEGRVVRLTALDAEAHAESLFVQTHGPEKEDLWRYMADGPFADRAAFDASLRRKAASEDPLYYAIVDRASGESAGYAAYLRIEPAHRCMEVGSIVYVPRFQRTVGATEAMYLMARHAFDDLGYRRYEWKCDARNAPSRRAALRFGFTFEGIFRQHMIVKAGNRDTAWYSMLDSEWPERRAKFERWLSPSNFDRDGRQLEKLSGSGGGDRG